MDRTARQHRQPWHACDTHTNRRDNTAGRSICASILALTCLIALIFAPFASASDRDLVSEITDSAVDYYHKKLGDDGKPVYNEYGEPIYDWSPMPSTTEDGRTVYAIDLFEHPDWKYRVHATYTLQRGYLTEADRTVIYHIPEGLAATQDSGNVFSPSNVELGTYTLDPTTRTFTVTFNEATVSANQTSAVDGWLRFEAQVNEAYHKTGGTIVLPGSGTVVMEVGKSYDISMTKQHGQFDELARTLPYTVTVESRYGTPGLLHFTDDMVNASVDFSTLQAKRMHADGTTSDDTWVDEHGEPITSPTGDGSSDNNGNDAPATQMHIDAYLPQLQPGEQVTITYTAKNPPLSGNSVRIANAATVTSTNDAGQRVSDNASTEYWYDSKTDLWKNGTGITASAISWEVGFNSWHKNLKGWTLKDVPGDNQSAELTNLQLYKRDTNGEYTLVDMPFTLPHTFTQNDTNEYKLTYDTTPKGDTQNGYSNTAQLCLGGICSERTASQNAPKPFTKTAGEVTLNTTNPEAMTATLTWTVTLGGDMPYDAGKQWVFTDALQQHDHYGTALPHYLTADQQQQVQEAIRNAFRQQFGELSTPTVAFTQSDERVTGFTITSAQRIPADKKISFTYTSTVDLGAGDMGWKQFDNCASIGSLKDCVPSWNFDTTPPETGTDADFRVVKYDGSNWQTSDTTHDYASLPHTNGGERYLDWAIDVYAPTLANGGHTLTVVETLPEGMHLLRDSGLSFRHDSAIMANETFRFDEHGKATITDGNGRLQAEAQIGGDNGRQVTITFLPAAWQDGNGNAMTVDADTVVRLGVCAGFDKAPYTMNSVAFTNQVAAGFKDTQTVTAKQTQHVNRDAYANLGDKQVMNKIPLYDSAQGTATSNKAVYQLSVNPDGICVGADVAPQNASQCSPGRISFTDTMTYRREIGYDNGELVLDPDSVQLYTPVSEGTEGAVRIARVGTNADGSAKFNWCHTTTKACQAWNPNNPAYEPVPSTTTVWARRLTADEYSYTISSAHPTGLLPDSELAESDRGKQIMQWTNTLEFTVPNMTPIIVDYAYTAIADLKDKDGKPQEPWIHVSNTMRLHGNDYAPADTNFAVHVAQANAGADTTTIGVTVRKVDAENNAKLLPGAHFRLEQWSADASEWVTVPDYTDRVAENGILPLTNGTLTYNRAYRLTELTAPDGYALAGEPLEFVIDKLVQAPSDDGDSSTRLVPDSDYPWQAPDGFSGQHVANNTTLFFENSSQPVLLPSAGGSWHAVAAGFTAGLVLIGAAFACAWQLARSRERR